MPARLIRTNEYQASAEDLSPNAKVSLQFVEEAIAADPGDRDAAVRYQVLIEGVLIVVDFRAQDLLVAYRQLDQDTVELMEVADARRMPVWLLPEE